jgi:copper(I)-binding protein
MSRNKRLMLMPGAAVAVALSLALGSVGAADEEDAMEDMDSMDSMEQMEQGLNVRHAWTRQSPMMDLAGAAYLVIHNNSDVDDSLIGASSPVAEVVEVHLSSMDDEGLMSMQQVQEVPIPAHGDAVLKPGSYHIMLINLVEPLTEGTEVEISLEFATAEPQTIIAPVQAGAPMGDMDMDDMDGENHDEMDDMDEMDSEEMEDDA